MGSDWQNPVDTPQFLLYNIFLITIMIKLLLTKTGEQIITKLDQYINPETNEAVGFLFINPFVVNLIPVGESANTDNPTEFNINYRKWLPCSADVEHRVAYDYIAAISDPEPQILTQYLDRFGDALGEKNDTTDGGDAGDIGTSDSGDSAEEPGVSDSTD